MFLEISDRIWGTDVRVFNCRPAVALVMFAMAYTISHRFQNWTILPWGLRC